ncbi:MAG: hypothetical protein E7413_01060 [Ruminococcaceae bacterium]|nr:hypothetical protein [Oscillospiraceae bacterium]
MSKTVRYTLIVIFSVCIPVAFLFLPAFFKVYIYSNSTESIFLYRTLESLIEYPDYLLQLIEYSEYNVLLQMVTFLLILFVCLLSSIFALAKSKGGVIVTAALGLITTLAFIGFYQQNASYYYSSNITCLLGPGTVLALVLRIVNLILAATEKTEVAFPPRATYPTYPTYPVYPTNPSNPTYHTNPTPPTYPTNPAHTPKPTYPKTPATPVNPLHHAAPILGDPVKPTANHPSTINPTIQSAAQSDDLTSNWTQF